MPTLTLQEAFDLAVQHHQAGRLQEAEQLYRQILAHQPMHAPAMHHLGLLAQQAGRKDIAVDLIRRAISIDPRDASAHSNLGMMLAENGQLDEAIATYRQAIALSPSFPDVHNNLGIALCEKGEVDAGVAAYRRAIALRPSYFQACSNLGKALAVNGQLDEAIAACRRAIALQPLFPEAHHILGNALVDLGRLDEAVAAYQQAIALRPGYAESYANLGIALASKGQLDQAVAAFGQAIALQPSFPEAHNSLGNVLVELGRSDEAIAAYRQAIALRPGYADPFSNLGHALAAKWQLDEAVAACRQAIALRPNFAEAYSNLGNALKDKGQLDDAIAAYRQATNLAPGLASAHSSLLFSLHYHPDWDARALAHEHQLWNQRHAQPLAQHIRPHRNDRDPERRLRIGYVSPDFHGHPVGRFILPLLANHDRRSVEVFAYAQVAVPDTTTQRLRSHIDVWRSLIGLSDAQVADLIREDRIDILVDLALHTANNRLLVFAQKPAPVQVTYLAYAGSSGLATMDYRLSDPYLDPLGEDESIYSEQTFRLPETYWCYQRVTDEPVGSLPALESGFITFGSLNAFCKITLPLLDLWAQVLQALPRSRLLLHAHEGTHRQSLLVFLQDKGIEPARVSFTERVSLATYYERYHSIDIALDTAPFGGGTTTCDTLWMGVPVVSLMGSTAVGRGGFSILSNIGLPQLVAKTPEEYVQIAVALANDLPRLKELRSTLRQLMQQSPLMDAPRFARNIEAAYRKMWRKWCATPPANP